MGGGGGGACVRACVLACLLAHTNHCYTCLDSLRFVGVCACVRACVCVYVCVYLFFQIMLHVNCFGRTVMHMFNRISYLGSYVSCERSGR